MKFAMTKERALQLGLLTCGTCGHPENNHFDFNSHPCAHCSCRSFSETSINGIELEVENSYQEVVANVARYIRENGPASPDCAFDAFCASSVLAVAFDKNKEDVMKDILRINLKAIRG